MDQETFYAFCFMVFCFSFYLLIFFAIMVDHRRQEDRQDRRDEREYQRNYKSRKKFGTEAVEQSLDNAHNRKSLIRRII